MLVAINLATIIMVACHVVKSLQLLWWSGTRRFNLWVPYFQISCRNLIWKIGSHDTGSNPWWWLPWWYILLKMGDLDFLSYIMMMDREKVVGGWMDVGWWWMDGWMDWWMDEELKMNDYDDDWWHDCYHDNGSWRGGGGGGCSWRCVGGGSGGCGKR